MIVREGAMAESRPTDPAASAKPPLTPQTRQAIIVAALVGCLIVGGGIVYWMLFGSSPKRRTVEVDPSKQTIVAPRPQARIRPREPRGVMREGNDWVIRGTTGEMRVPPNPDGVTFRFPEGLKLPQDQVTLISSRWRILNDEAMAAEWGVTAEQKEKLGKMKIAQGGMSTTADQRQALRQLWDAYNKAGAGQGKTDAQKALTDKLDEIAKSSFEADRKAFGERLDEMKRILSPEQIEKITKR
jgi:hypothetical protein